MENVIALQGMVLLVVTLALVAIKIFALVTALGFSPQHYEAAGKLTKPAWVAILGLAVAANVILLGSPIGLVNLAFTIATFVYLADVRPALQGLHQR
ncbi:DUF2516 family protein [Nocardioides sp.]|uniref:DUF2516 family protein n=1 Tax=Nocardioides sp. TaxID=35761 RepID=UPI002ED02F56